jgi:hypothetical protein
MQLTIAGSLDAAFESVKLVDTPGRYAHASQFVNLPGWLIVRQHFFEQLVQTRVHQPCSGIKIRTHSSFIALIDLSGEKNKRFRQNLFLAQKDGSTLEPEVVILCPPRPRFRFC